MKETTKVWDKSLEDALESMVAVFRKSIITDAESFAEFYDSDKVTANGLEVALYKSIMTLNESNKAIMIKKLGPIESIKMIRSLEDSAIIDVSLCIIEDLESNFDSLPPEIQEIIKELKKKVNENKNKNKEMM